MPQHNTTTTPRRCSNVSITRVQAHKIPDQIHAQNNMPPLTLNIVITETVHQEYTQNATRGSTTVRKIVTASHNVVDTWNCQQNQTPNFASPMLAPMKIRENKTTPHDLGFGQNLDPFRTNHEFVNVEGKEHISSLGDGKRSNATQHYHTTDTTAPQMRPSSFFQRTRFPHFWFAEQHVTS